MLWFSLARGFSIHVSCYWIVTGCWLLYVAGVFGFEPCVQERKQVMSGDIQADVARTAWPWRDGAKAKDASPKHAVRRAWIQAVIMLMVAVVMFFVLHKTILPMVVTALALVNLLLGLFWAKGFLAVERFWLGAAHGVGVGLGWVLLTPFFFLCFAPARLLLVMRGRDPMRRRFPAPGDTCWILREQPQDKARYGKQF